LALSDTLIEELEAADTIVIGMPIYNFGMPAALKAWIDLMARPKVTFAYTESGPVGLLNDKRAIVAVASGGVPVDSPADFATPHLRQVLRFVGIDDITVHAAKDLISANAA
jgi:FMN-dependent NADH-azoreductase